MRFDEWFDVYSADHMKAYEYLGMNGTWPDGFLPDEAEITMIWLPKIQAKMAQAWLKAVKEGAILGFPGFDA